VLITVEEGSVGGFGSYVLHALAEHGALENGLKVRCLVLPDTFIDQDSPAVMYAKASLDAKGIVAKVFEALAATSGCCRSWAKLHREQGFILNELPPYISATTSEVRPGAGVSIR